MASDRQIEANRENAKHSTGPRTNAGKAASSRNNTRHGLTAAGLIIPPGQEEAFANHQAGLRASLQPEGELQETLFARALHCSWNLHRCRIAEKDLYSSTGIDPLIDQSNTAMYDRIQKYTRENESGFHKSIKALGELQTEAAYRDKLEPPVMEDPPNPPVEVEKSPHSHSEVCNLAKVNRSTPIPQLASNWKNHLPRPVATIEWVETLDNDQPRL